MNGDLVIELDTVVKDFYSLFDCLCNEGICAMKAIPAFDDLHGCI